MAVFQHVLWGYELTYPDGWIHQTQGFIETFAAIPDALSPDYSGPNSGQIMVRGEWNSRGEPIAPIWNRHIGMLSSWLGARKVGSAPWRLGEAAGIEAEIVLPTKDPRRLWTGILAHRVTVLNFVVLHLKEERSIFEPAATQVISSLRFPGQVEGAAPGPLGLPLPPGYAPIPVMDVLDDIRDPQYWSAYDGESDIGALQAFYTREIPRFGWQISEYIPYPGSTELGFARLKLEQTGRQVTLGILPYPGEDNRSTLGRLIFKLPIDG